LQSLTFLLSRPGKIRPAEPAVFPAGKGLLFIEYQLIKETTSGPSLPGPRISAFDLQGGYLGNIFFTAGLQRKVSLLFSFSFSRIRRTFPRPQQLSVVHAAVPKLLTV
jgi:hypothetical protein